MGEFSPNSPNDEWGISFEYKGITSEEKKADFPDASVGGNVRVAYKLTVPDPEKSVSIGWTMALNPSRLELLEYFEKYGFEEWSIFLNMFLTLELANE